MRARLSGRPHPYLSSLSGQASAGRRVGRSERASGTAPNGPGSILAHLHPLTVGNGSVTHDRMSPGLPGTKGYQA